METRVCPRCGSTDIRPVEKPLYRGHKHGSGLGWIILVLLTCGLALLFYMVTASKKQVIGVDRYWLCFNCNLRQPG